MTAHSPTPMFRYGTPQRPYEDMPRSTLTLDLRAVLSTLSHQRSAILVPVLASLVIALFVYLTTSPRFVASAQLLVDPRGLQVADKELTPAGQSSEAGLPLVESQVRIITSERVLRELISRENLHDDPEFTESSGVVGSVIGSLKQWIGVHDKREEPVVRALRTIQKRASARRGERSFVIDVSFEAKTPQKAAHLANALAAAYLESDFAARSSVAKRVEQSLSGRLSELRDQVRQAEERVEAYKAENDIVGASGQLVSEQQLVALNAQLAEARSRSAELKARSDLIERARQRADLASIAEAVQSPTISQMRGQYVEVERRYSEALTLLGPRHPEIANIQAQMRAVSSQIKDELGRIARSARADYDRAHAKEVALSGDLDKAKTSMLSTKKASVRLRELERAAESNRGVYEAFLRRTKEVGEQQSVDNANSRIISEALPPREKLNASLITLLLGAALMGVGIGTVFVLGRRAWLQSSPAFSEAETRIRFRATNGGLA
ncbi:MAG TPA: GumC family protein [Beijerinckiaceae bacterium]